MSRVKPAYAALMAGLSVLLSLCITTGFTFWTADRAVRSEVKSALKRLAAVSASVIDADVHKHLTRPTQETSPEYLRAIEPLGKIVGSNDQITFVYTLIFRGSSAFFILDPTEAGDSDHDGVEDKSHIMQEYPDVSTEARQAFFQGESTVEPEPYTDQWGTFLSGYAPIRDASGTTVAIVGVDLSAEAYMARLNGVRNAMQTGLIIAFLVSVLAAGFVFVAQSKSQAYKAKIEADQAKLAKANRCLEDQNQELQDSKIQLERANNLAAMTHEKLKTVSMRFEQLFHKLPVACFTFDEAGNIREWNPEFEKLLGLDVTELFEKPSAELLPELSNAMRNVFTGENLQGFEWSFEKKGSEAVHLSLVSNAFAIQIDDKCVGAIGAIIDITERQQLQAQLADKLNLAEDLNRQLGALSVTDGLTGVKNRRAFQDELAKQFALARRNCRSLSVILLDVDNFKSYNDTFGHPAGDRVLVEAAQILGHQARVSDFVARYGGEEFVIILPETDKEEACRVAERVRVALENHQWTELRVTASFGVATLTDDISHPDRLIKEADDALYFAKESGRNRVVHIQAATNEDAA